MANDYRISITIEGKDNTRAAVSGAAAGFADVEKAAGSASHASGGFFANLLSTAGGFLAANVIGKIAGEFKDFIGGAFQDAREANVLMAATEQTIKSTGGAAGMSAQQVADLASQMSAAAGKSPFGDDLIQQGENVLLTFTNIGKDVFPLATQASLDMATALHKTPEAMSMMLGKALNSAEGFTALKKSGVAFTDAQEKMIKRLFETGHAAEAQKIILGELATEFGGQAEAAAKADGGMAQFRDRLGEMGESLAAKLLPTLGIFVGFLNDSVLPVLETGLNVAIDWLTTTGLPALTAGWEALQPTIATVADVIGVLVDAGVGLYDIFFNRDFTGGIFGLQEDDPIITILFAIRDGIAGLADEIVANALPALADFGAFLTDTALPALGAGLRDALAWLADVGIPALTQAWADLQPSLAAAGDFISTNLNPILWGLGAVVLAVVVPAFAAWAIGAAAAGVATLVALAPILIPLAAIGVAVALLKAAWDGDFGGIRTTLTNFWEQTGRPVFEMLSGWLAEKIPSAVSTVSGFFTQTLWPALQKVWSFLDGTLFPVLSALANVWFALVKKEIEILSALWNNVLWPALEKVGTFISGTLAPVLARLSQDAMHGVDVVGTALAAVITTVLGPAFTWLNDNVIGPATVGFGHISASVNDVISFLHRLASSIDAIEIPSWLQGHSPPPLADWFSYIGDAVDRVAGESLPDFRGALLDAGGAIAGAATSIGGPLQDAIDTLGSTFGRSKVPDAAKGFGQDILANIGRGMEDGTARAVGIGEDAKDTIGEALGVLPQAMPQVGEATVDGIQQGVENKWDGFRNWMGNQIGDKLVDWVKQKLGIASPSLVFADIGSNMLAGLVLGMGDAAPELTTVVDGIIDGLKDQLDDLRASMKDASSDVREGIQQQISDVEAQINALAGAAGKLPDLIADATAGLYEVSASVARQLEKNLGHLDDYGAAQQETIRTALFAADAAAQLIPDPAEASQFFALRSKQIFELADLEKQKAEAGAAQRKKIEEEHTRFLAGIAADRAKLQQDLTKTNENEAKSLADLQGRLAGATTDADRKKIADQIAAVQAAAAAERKRIDDEIQRKVDAKNAELLSYNAAIEANRLLAIEERTRLEQRIALVKQAQAAEQQAQKTHQANELSMFEKLAQQVTGLFNAIPGSVPIPANWAKSLSDFNSLITQLNHLYSQPPPNWIPQPPPMTGNAMGTSSWGGGLTWVGERGRELVNLPRGSQIFSNRESERMAAGGNHYHLHLTTSAPTVSLIQEFSMLQASAGVS